MRQSIVLVCFWGLLGAGVFTGCQKTGNRVSPEAVLIFHKTAGFHHESIDHGIEVMSELITQNGLTPVVSEDASVFAEDTLQLFSAVIFLNTTGDVLDDGQQAAFERYIQAGGGFIGIHAAADTEYKWPWYNRLVGGYFNGHPNNPNVRKATVVKTDNSHVSTDHFPASFERTDEWYNYRNLFDGIIPLLKLDESTYEGGTMEGDHPITWYHEYDGGKAFYTGFGHTKETYDEPAFRKMMDEALQYVMSSSLNFTKARSAPKPDADRFSKEVLASNLDEPTEIAVLPDDRVLFVERKGAVKLYVPGADSVRTIARLDVHTEFEDGLMGLALDPDFQENHYVYMYYSPAGNEPVQNLSRFEMDGDRLLLYTERIIMQVPVQRKTCCHTGGSIAFGPDGNLFLSTGDDTNPFASDGYAPIDEQEGREPWDGQRAPGNTNDLRGKILRITVNDDASYSIPEGNLFPPGTPDSKPEIYVMGCRNPYRIHVDKKTGVLYWGDVGPDANESDSLRGPRGHDEVNRAATPGFYGWPYFIANNKPYRNYDFATGQSGDYFDPENPVNNSRNNTGRKNLPPARPALIWYPYSVSEEFPIVRNGSRNAMAGFVYYHDLFEETSASFPAYYDGKLIAYDWMRNWVIAVTLDDEGNILSLEPMFSNLTFNNLIDMDFSKEGVMYTIEYGTGWFQQNQDARLSRINYNSGNRPPVTRLAVDKAMGQVPLNVSLDASESMDPDGDPLHVEWYVGREKVGEGPTLQHTFDKSGYYFVNAVVSDGKDKTKDYVIVRPGNEPPQVSIEINGNSTFYWDNESISYQVTVKDAEDGSTGDGRITGADVSISEDFLAQGYDMTEIAQGHQLPSPVVIGKNAMESLDCKACHKLDAVSAGPSYTSVAARYADDPGAVDYLSNKIIQGGGGNWGEQAMAAHPDLEPGDAANIVRYILSLNKITSESGSENQGLKGSMRFDRHAPDNRSALYMITASYTDAGNEYGGLDGSDQVILRHPRLQAENYSHLYNGNQYARPNGNLILNNLKHGSYARYDDIDLTGVRKVDFNVRGGAGGEIILRTGSPNGKEIGRATVLPDDYQLISITIDGEGLAKELFIAFENPGEETPLLELDWIEFKR